MDDVVQSRNEAFKSLRPICVKVSELAVQINEDIDRHTSAVVTPGTAAELKELLLELLKRLNEQLGDANVFDRKLADFVFFPLSLIFRRARRQPAFIIELALRCLNFILQHGWNQQIQLELAHQLLPLLTLIAGGISETDEAPIPEEVKIEAYHGVLLLFRDVENSFQAVRFVNDETIVPVIGQCIYTLTEDVKNSIPEIQLKALQALEAIWSCLKDRELLATFLPGTVSAISRCLTPKSQSESMRGVLVAGLRLLGLELTTILGDVWMRKKDSQEQSFMGDEWLTATVENVGLALGSAVKLRKHPHELVRNAVRRLCLRLLDECNQTLQPSIPLLVETAISLWEPDEENTPYTGEAKLTDLAVIYPALGEQMKTTLYNWIAALPGTMLAHDEASKQTAIGNLSKGYKLCASLQESSILEGALRDALRDSVTTLAQQSSASRISETAEGTDVGALIATNTPRSLEFRPVLISHQSQRETRQQLMSFLHTFGSQVSQIRMAGEMLEYLQGGSIDVCLSSFWLSLNLLKAADADTTSGLDEFLNFEPASDEMELVREELYSYAVSVLSDADTDWRLQAVALEAVAYAAQKLGEDFRSELVDSLYPVVQLVASPNLQLREHAITSIEVISQSCGYESPSDLIVQNADYMVNSIALKLNSFDISPQAPQVLTVMIRLTGARIIPYLDDVIGSIFTALDNFHGYTSLVEVLFAVLGEVVDEAARSGLPQLTDGSTAPRHQKSEAPGPAIDDMVKLVEKWRGRKQVPEPHEDFPRAPWKSAKTLLDEHGASEETDATEEGGETSTDVQKPAPTKTYTLVQNIARLSQHYLTSSSPYLRHRLLSLITTASSALAHNEDAFLPLVNDLWPVLIPRLHDPEAHVMLTACETLTALCTAAGDFMSTRIRMAWPDLLKLGRRASADARGRRGHRGIYDQKQQIWEALVGLLATIMEYVSVEESMLEDALELVGPDTLHQRPDVKRAFEAVNSDAVWLLMQLSGLSSTVLPTPIMKGCHFVDLGTIRA